MKPIMPGQELRGTAGKAAFLDWSETPVLLMLTIVIAGILETLADFYIVLFWTY